MTSLKYIHPDPSLCKTLYIIVGEAPGAEEEERGIPFVGKAGKMLRQTLQELGILNNCYFTNAVKIRPPRNRKPTKEEVKSWLPILINEIFELSCEEVRLFTFGATATKAVAMIAKQYPELNYFKNNWYVFSHPSWIARYGHKNKQQWINFIKRAIDGNRIAKK
ncbi:MAG: uracil-DNA glycosylase family protein [Thermoplasmatales archaeon]